MDGAAVMALNVTGNAFRVTFNTKEPLHQKSRDGKYSFSKGQRQRH